MSTLSAFLLQGLAEYVSLTTLRGVLSDLDYHLRTADAETFLKFGVVLVVVLAFTVRRIRVR